MFESELFTFDNNGNSSSGGYSLIQINHPTITIFETGTLDPTNTNSGNFTGQARQR